MLLYEEIISAEKYYSAACLDDYKDLVVTHWSELAYLGIPAISFVSGCTYRKVEQTNNINNLKTSTIMSASLDITPKEFAGICVKMMEFKADNTLQCSNNEAIKHILKL